jgi:membrane-bound serine protease (ClpP class)
MPGFGIAGILGVVSLVVGIVLVSQLVSILVLILIIAAVLVIIAGLLVFMYKSATKGGRMSKLLLLNTNTSKEEGFTSTLDIEEDLVGLEGIAETILRPAGTGLFGKRKIDVVTEGEFIQRGSKIKIVKIEGFRVIVEEIE